MKKNKRIMLLFVGAVLLMGLASIVSGGGLGCVVALHVVVGNILIGVGEGLFLSKAYRYPKRKGIPRLVVANYMVTGLLALLLFAERGHGDQLSLQKAPIWLLWMIGASCAVMMTVKYGAILYCFRRRSIRFWRALKATLVTQIPVFLILLAWYAPACSMGLYTESELTAPDRFSSHPTAWCYYLSGDDGMIYRCRLDGSGAEFVSHGPADRSAERLFLSYSKSSRCWDLRARIRRGEARSDTLILPSVVSAWAMGIRPAGPRSRHLTLIDLRPKTGQQRQFLVSLDRFRGLEVITHKVANGFAATTTSTERFILALSTPFLSWRVQNATVLPGDQIVFQIGDLICLFDPETRKIGMIARGRSPVVVVE